MLYLTEGQNKQNRQGNEKKERMNSWLLFDFLKLEL